MMDLHIPAGELMVGLNTSLDEIAAEFLSRLTRPSGVPPSARATTSRQ